MSGIGNRRWVAVGGVAAVTALVLAAVWFEANRSVTQPVRLADGTHIRIRSVAVGPEMHSPYDSHLARWVARLPKPIRGTVGRVVAPSPIIWTGMPLSMGIWLECDKAPDLAGTNRGSSDSAFLVLLNDGRPFRVSALTWTVARLPDGRYVEGHFFPMPPATLPQISVSLFPRPASGSLEPEGWIPLTQWSIRPPHPLPKPTNWLKESLPLRRVSEDLEVVLTNLVVNAYPHEGWDMAVPDSLPQDDSASARFELFHAGRPATQWQLERVSSLMDPYGGSFGSALSSQNGSNFVQWSPIPWPGHLWRLGVEFTRISGFASNEIVTFTNLIVGESQPVSKMTVHGGVSVKRVGESHWDYPDFDLVLSFQPVRQPARLTLLSVSDAQGNPVHGTRSSWSDTENTFRLTGSSPTNGPFTATLALQLGTVLEFTAEPKVGTPTPPGQPTSPGP